MVVTTGVTASQAWSILKRHATDDIEPLRLHELCRDNDRVSSLVAVYNTTFTGYSIYNTTRLQPLEDDEAQQERILIADLSRQRMTLETLSNLLQLATAVNLKRFITQLAWGRPSNAKQKSLAPVFPARVRGKIYAEQQRNQHHRNQQHHYRDYTPASAASVAGATSADQKTTRFLEMEPASPSSSRMGVGPVAITVNSNNLHNDADTTTVPSMHLALRVPANKGFEMLLPNSDGMNILTSIHRSWDRLERLSDCIRRGQLRGASGNMIRNVIVVGRGVPISALKFVYTALLHDERAVLASRFGLVAADVGVSAASVASSSASRILRRNLHNSSSAGSAGSSSGGGGGGGSGGGLAARRLFFLTSVDPVAAADIVSDLDPGSTLVVSIALNGNEETGLATRTLKSWLLHSLGSHRRADHVLAKHMMLVTGNDRIVSVINKPESVHHIPEHFACEAFSTFTPVTLVPLSIVFGWPIVQEFIDGAHDMDLHFVETNPRHNLPVLLALTDIWNDTLLSSTSGSGAGGASSPSSRIVTPFTGAFAGYPAFVGALESQTCCRRKGSASGNIHGASSAAAISGTTKLACSATVVDGGLDGSYDRAFYQSSKVMNSELIMAMDTQVAFHASRTIGASGLEDVYATQDMLMCSVFAHADELAFGYKRNGGDTVSSPASITMNSVNSDINNNSISGDVSEGNRPSLLLMLGKLDAFACGQLIALSEHRAVVKAHIWGLDPFVREVGSSLRMYRTDQLKDDLQELFTRGNMDDDDDDDDDEEGEDGVNGRMNLSTKTILRHYASLMKDQRLQHAVNNR